MDKLRKKVDECNLDDYEHISKKLEKIEVVENIDKEILEKFKKKKGMIEHY